MGLKMFHIRKAKSHSIFDQYSTVKTAPIQQMEQMPKLKPVLQQNKKLIAGGRVVRGRTAL